jgi:hypothetical protein
LCSNSQKLCRNSQNFFLRNFQRKGCVRPAPPPQAASTRYPSARKGTEARPFAGHFSASRLATVAPCWTQGDLRRTRGTAGYRPCFRSTRGVSVFKIATLPRRSVKLVRSSSTKNPTSKSVPPGDYAAMPLRRFRAWGRRLLPGGHGSGELQGGCSPRCDSGHGLGGCVRKFSAWATRRRSSSVGTSSTCSVFPGALLPVACGSWSVCPCGRSCSESGRTPGRLSSKQLSKACATRQRYRSRMSRPLYGPSASSSSATPMCYG